MSSRVDVNHNAFFAVYYLTCQFAAFMVSILALVVYHTNGDVFVTGMLMGISLMALSVSVTIFIYIFFADNERNRRIDESGNDGTGDNDDDEWYNRPASQPTVRKLRGRIVSREASKGFVYEGDDFHE